MLQLLTTERQFEHVDAAEQLLIGCSLKANILVSRSAVVVAQCELHENFEPYSRHAGSLGCAGLMPKKACAVPYSLCRSHRAL